LNTPNGIVDLNTGKMREARAEDLCTKMTAVAPDSKCKTPLWTKLLEWAQKDDPEVIPFLQRVAGYCLTGRTDEQALFFFHGFGGNGKGTFLNTFAAILGDYATTAPIETFSAKQSQHPTDLAMLQGARLVTAQETDEGTRWA